MTRRESPRARRWRHLRYVLCALALVVGGWLFVGSFLVAVG